MTSSEAGTLLGCSAEGRAAAAASEEDTAPGGQQQETDCHQKASSSSAGYGSFPARSRAPVKPGGSQELVTISIRESPLHQQHETDDLEMTSYLLELKNLLFQYMEKQTSEVELELVVGARQESINSKGSLDPKPTTLSLNNDDFLEIDEDHFKLEEGDFLQVEDEREHYKQASESLQKLRQEILRLRRHLDSECTKLDLMDDFEDAHEKVQRKFARRLTRCLEETTHRMDDILHKYNLIVDGVRQNKYHMENPVNDLIRTSPIGCAMWLHFMLFLVLLGAIASLYLWSRSSGEWTVYLRLLRSPLLVVLFLYLYGINMKVWAAFRVDYATIFSHPSGATPTPEYMFKTASILTVIMALLVISVIVATPYSVKLPIKIVPVLMWLALFSFLLNPFNVFMKKARFNFISTFLRILFSPFFFVYFTDFFLADQFNSSIAIFLDIEYLICYVTADSWSDSDINSSLCTSSWNGIRPIVSLLPAFWRFLQCLRCFYDTYNPKHLVNAGKYFSILPVVLFATLFSKADPNTLRWIFTCWFISASIHGVYTFLWDITGDWGLLTIRCSVFQRKLAYGHKVVYVVAIALDLMLRFFWSIKLTLAIAEQKSELIFTGLIVAEILRRFTWNFFRIEHAHMLSLE